jgi:predicted acyl esterase
MTGSPVADPRGSDTDHVVIGLRQRGCVTTDRPETPGVATWRVPIESDFTLIGAPRLELAYDATSAAPELNVELNSRLWDVAPDGTQTLVTRGAYRFVGEQGAHDAVYDLYGNHWKFEQGHELMLEVTGDDSTFFRRDNFPSVITVDSAKLTLPGVR